MAAEPRWELDSALVRGREAERLLADNSAVLTPELDEGLGAQLDADLALLSVESDDNAVAEQRTATATEREIARDAHDLLMVIREAVQRSRNGTASLQAAMGVGQTLNPSNTKGVLNALGAVAEHAAALRTCGVPAGSITEAADLATQLQASDSTQTEAIQDRARATDTRTLAQLRIEAAVDAIYIAGLFLFRKDAATRARFEALVSSEGPPPEPAPVDPAA